MGNPEELFAIGSPGQSLRVEIVGPYNVDALDPTMTGWLNAAIHVDAFPFSGSIQAIFAPDDVEQYQQAIVDFAQTGRARMGGGRAPEIILEREDQVVEVTVTPSGDDPQPLIRYLIFLDIAPTDDYPGVGSRSA
jgi:hypothetical protein